MKLKTYLAALALVSATAISIPAVAKVDIVQKSSPALVSGSTFAWAPVAGFAFGSPAPAVVNEITAERLEAATEAALAAKGYKQVRDPFDADLIVAYRVMTKQSLDANLSAQGVGCGPLCRQPVDYKFDSSEKTHGTLVLDLVEAHTGQLVYRATAEKELSSKDASSERLGAILKKMTRALPAQAQ